jgi:hypothetical protein
MEHRLSRVEDRVVFNGGMVVSEPQGTLSDCVKVEQNYDMVFKDLIWG